MTKRLEEEDYRGYNEQMIATTYYIICANTVVNKRIMSMIRLEKGIHGNSFHSLTRPFFRLELFCNTIFNMTNDSDSIPTYPNVCALN